MYCSINDIYSAVKKDMVLEAAQNDSEETITVTEARITEAINRADARIDGALYNKYTVPLSEDHKLFETVRNISIDFAVYNIFSRKGFSVKGSVEEIFVKRAEEAQALLEKIAGFQDNTAIGRTSTGDMRLKIKSNPSYFDKRGF